MRLWHYELLPYLPELQFKGQLREVIAIMRDWQVKGKTNHILINKVTEYEKKDLSTYFYRYMWEYYNRYNKHIDIRTVHAFEEFSSAYYDQSTPIFIGWHTKEYLRSNMANLWEKHFMGVGKSRISDEEWETLLRGYKEITGEEYVI